VSATGGGPTLGDGTYDVFIVDATVEAQAGADGDARVVHLELTIISGPQKGEVVSVAATGLDGEDFELLGMPGTLTVVDGAPRFRLDD
jgi:hypothetical protein